MSEAEDHRRFIKSKLDQGMEPGSVIRFLTSAGWQHHAAQLAVKEAVEESTPPPPKPKYKSKDEAVETQSVEPNVTAQTGNTAAEPIQVENVQYNMKTKPVESRIGTFIKISAVGLWLTVVFVSWFMASIIGLASDGNTDGIPTQIVLTVSISAVSVPMFVIADRKVREELLKNKDLFDDLFFKKHVRSGLNASIGLTGFAAFISLFTFLSAAFIADSNTSVINGFQSVIFTAGFGGALYYYWHFHAKTKR